MQTAIRLVSRELTEAAGLWDLRLLEDDDGEYFFRVINASNGIRFVPQSWVYYRIPPTSHLKVERPTCTVLEERNPKEAKDREIWPRSL